jgi:uncharacterized membrane protein YwaF
MMNVLTFIPYFWRNEGFNYDPTRQYMFGWYHIVMLVAMILLFIFLWFIGRKKEKRDNQRFLRIISIFLIALEMLRLINYHYVYNYTWLNSISFHMCSWGVYFAVIAGLFQKRILFEVAAIPAVVGGLTSIIIPHGILPYFNDFSFMAIQSNISHLLMFFVIVYAIKSNIWKPKLKRFWISAFSISITIVLIHLINLYKNSLGYNTNYFWTMYPDPRFPVINEWVFPYHTLFLSFGLIFLGFGFYYIVDKLIISKKIR